MKKQPAIRSRALRDLAKGQTCTMQIPGVCNYDPTTTVLAHFPDESHGMGRKSDDLSAGFCCSACHNTIDLRRRSWMAYDDAEREFYMRRSMIRTWRIAIEAGVICLSA